MEAAFCDLQSIIEIIGMDSPYQETAKAISGAVYSPEDVTQILDLLAAPVVQIQEAFLQHDKALLPRREPRKRVVLTQECLASRLENTGSMAGPPYACISMPVLRYHAEYPRSCQNRLRRNGGECGGDLV